ncbi:DUF3530 family protein [Shewanella youngdeokensis]|uniref:DUF3530 family protein n=1 Tax=Shewanella youngdeokensis TaxID=2999068 RepID=A0ABZ0JWY0_9GAMM|nr:DUF3530 family protein [Shewanella sp. DAU334]
MSQHQFNTYFSLPRCLWFLPFALICFTANAAEFNLNHVTEKEINYLSIDDKQYPVLLRSWQGKKKLGLAIIVPALGQSPDAAGFNAYLRRQLNNAGWATLSITPPLKTAYPNHVTQPEDVAKAGTQQMSQQADQAMPIYNAEQLALNTEQQQSFLTNSLSQLDELGQPYQGKRILICSGDSAGHIIELLRSSKLPVPDILVVINPYRNNPSNNKILPSQLAEITVPVLDIQSEDGTAASKSTQQRRFELSPQNAPLRYHQQKMSLDLQHQTGWSNGKKVIEGFALRINKAYPNR